MKMKKAYLAVLILALAAPAMANDPKSELKIKHRRAAFTLLSSYFSKLLNVVDGEVEYNKQAVVENARLVEMLSRLPWEGFAPGTEHGYTRAKFEIWVDEDEFRRLADDLQRKVTELRVATESAGPEQVKTAFLAARKSCSTCHDRFREKDFPSE
jgi:cytochrome c556